MVWPTVEKYHADSDALNILSTYLSKGKRAPLNEVLIDEMKLTSNVSMIHNSKEISGEMYLMIDANPNEDLDDLGSAITKSFARFESNGISDGALKRIKAGLEVSFYGKIQSALGKAITLGEYNTFTGDPGFIKKDLQRIQAVTKEDVKRVYNRYIKDKHYIAISMVPKGQIELSLEGATMAQIVEEKVVQSTAKVIAFDPKLRTFTPTASSFDRSTEPKFGQAYTLPSPTIWRDNLSNGMSMIGIESDETPLIYFSLAIDAGRDRGDINKPAVASLTADLMNKGTVTKTTADLEDAINALGSNINIHAGNYGTYIKGSTLARNFESTMNLLTEMLLEPRWDAEEFAILIRSKRNELEQGKGNPNLVSARESRKLRYNDNHMFHYLPYGTIDKLDAISIDDLKAFYTRILQTINSQAADCWRCEC